MQIEKCRTPQSPSGTLQHCFSLFPEGSSMTPRSYYENGQGNSAKFDPPLWKQRRNFIEDVLQRFAVESVLDYGCGEATVLSFLITPNGRKVTRLAGIDIDEEALQDAIESCEPWDNDYRYLRTLPLTVDLYQGSIGIPDDRLIGYEAIVCSEVIEHVSSDVLYNFFELTLSIYKPRVLIVTTPNAEYNVNFPNLNYGTAEAIFRHDDHKFEWTRNEFQSWCEAGARQFGYQVEFHGIGLLQGRESEIHNGHCTQACVFINPNYKAPNITATTKHGEPHQLLKSFDFPYYNEPPLTADKIAKELGYYVETLCRAELYMREEVKLNVSELDNADDGDELDAISFDQPLDWSTLNISEIISTSTSSATRTEVVHRKALANTVSPVTLPVTDLWSILRIQQICQNEATLLDILFQNFNNKRDYEVDAENKTLIVYKTFEVSQNAK